MPNLKVGDEVIKVVEPLQWYQWLWIALPVVLIFAGGAIGAVFGIIAVSINAKMFRSSQNTVTKYLVTGGISFAAGIAYTIIAVLIAVMIG